MSGEHLHGGCIIYHWAELSRQPAELSHNGSELSWNPLVHRLIAMEQLVAYVLHPSCKGAKLSPDQLIVVTDSVTLGSFFLEERFSSQ